MAEDTKSVLSFSGEHRWLSNFWVAPIELRAFGEGWTFRSSEQVYQMAKLQCAYLDPDQVRELFEEIRSTETSGQSKRFGQRIPELNVAHWDSIKDRTMLEITRAKFSQNPALLEQLLGLEGYYLGEGNSWGDRYWGVDGGVGQNRLGKILMAVRDSWLIEREGRSSSWVPRPLVPEYDLGSKS